MALRGHPKQTTWPLGREQTKQTGSSGGAAVAPMKKKKNAEGTKPVPRASRGWKNRKQAKQQPYLRICRAVFLRVNLSRAGLFLTTRTEKSTAFYVSVIGGLPFLCVCFGLLSPNTGRKRRAERRPLVRDGPEKRSNGRERIHRSCSEKQMFFPYSFPQWSRACSLASFLPYLYCSPPSPPPLSLSLYPCMNLSRKTKGRKNPRGLPLGFVCPKKKEIVFLSSDWLGSGRIGRGSMERLQTSLLCFGL